MFPIVSVPPKPRRRRTCRRAALLALIVITSVAPRPGSAWETFVPWYDWSLQVVSVHFDRLGNVILTALADDVVQSSSRTVSFSRAGAVRWTFDAPGDGSGGENQIVATAADHRGDIVLVGRDHGIEDTFQGYQTVI